MLNDKDCNYSAIVPPALALVRQAMTTELLPKIAIKKDRPAAVFDTALFFYSTSQQATQ